MLLGAGAVQTAGALVFAYGQYDLRHNGNAEGYPFSVLLSVVETVGGTLFALVAGTILSEDGAAVRSCREGDSR